MTTAMLVKLPSLRRDHGSATTPAFVVILATSAAGFAFAAPPTVEAVNHATGVPNISALIVYCILSLFSCASLVLLMHWRGGPEGVVRRHTRMWMAATAAIVVVFCVLFALSNTPVERARDLDTYYANTPYIREMITLYLLAHTATTLTVITMCWGWIRGLGSGWTRRVLLALMAGYAMSLAFAVLKGIAVSARWWAATDRWDWLSTDAAPPFAGLGALISTVACLVSEYGPPIGNRWRAWLSYQRMEPLWRALAPWGGSGPPMKMPRFTGIEVLEMQRATDIRDRLLRLSPYLNTAQLQAAQRLAAVEGPARATALIEAEAAEIYAALATVPVVPSRGVHGLSDTIAPPASGTVPLAGTHRLAELSQAFSALSKARPSTAASESR
ncbi:MAB_1171c family putative transporter [Streptomyces sp. NPDC057011]|uniref:MAB_1171c family putative transporter n=1 Tax=unclassified Streptomyces TaxID=2593676 RepID=UPI00363FD0FA